MNIWGIIVGLLFVAFGIGIALNIDVWRYLLPLIFIMIGLSIIFGRGRHQASKKWTGNPAHTTTTHEDKLNYSFSFSGADLQVVSNDFKGGKINCFFGGANIDLRESKIIKDGTVYMEVSALFGGIKLMVPKTWRVQGTLSGFLGGFSNSAVDPDRPEGTLVLKGSGTFGGGEVTN